MERLRLSLFELNSMVRDVISMSLPDSYWVEAELSEAREGYGGHCYLELIEKDERSNTPIAKRMPPVGETDGCSSNRISSASPDSAFMPE